MPKRKREKKTSKEVATSERKNPPASEDLSWSKSKKKRMRRSFSQKEKPNHQNRSERGQSSKKASKSAGGEIPTASPSLDNDVARKGGTKVAKSTRLSKGANPGGDEPRFASAARPMSALQKSFLARLSGSRFRELNEELYTSSSDTAFQRFTENPDLFDRYHAGFRTQVAQWPVNPVDVILRWIIKLERKQRVKVGNEARKLVVADFGCGDAKLARELLKVHAPPLKTGEETKAKKKKHKSAKEDGSSSPFEIHSFDLVSSGNALITACDMADVPIEDDSVDIAVFCLALMGTNIADFIREAHRVLRREGVLKIAEVRSRFESTTNEGVDTLTRQRGKRKKSKHQVKGKDLSSKQVDGKLLNHFLSVMEELGFRCKQTDRSNKMFVLMEFVKTGEKPSKDATFTAKPCIYKRR